jgi:hypothetical protein
VPGPVADDRVDTELEALPDVVVRVHGQDVDVVSGPVLVGDHLGMLAQDRHVQSQRAHPLGQRPAEMGRPDRGRDQQHRRQLRAQG